MTQYFKELKKLYKVSYIYLLKEKPKMLKKKIFIFTNRMNSERFQANLKKIHKLTI